MDEVIQRRFPGARRGNLPLAVRARILIWRVLHPLGAHHYARKAKIGENGAFYYLGWRCLTCDREE